jgi:hypothetical protein
MSPESGASNLLPEGFSNLEHLVSGWARPTERERRHLCAAKSMADIEAYYTLLGPNILTIAEHLDAFPMQKLPEPEARLMMLAQMHLETAVAVEFLHAPDMGPEQITPDRWHILDV